MAAKRYRVASAPATADIVLLFAHGTGFRAYDPPCTTVYIADSTYPDKEHFEPMLQDFLAAQGTTGRPAVCEAWAFDWQTHGDSAVLNQGLIPSGSTELPGESQLIVFSFSMCLTGTLPGVSIWARAIAEFIKAGHVRGKRLIAAGHSVGNTAM